MTDGRPTGHDQPSGPITSLTNPRIKATVRLRDRRERDATGLTIVDGAREILRALGAGVRVETAFIAPDLIRSPDAAQVADRLRGRTGTVEVSPQVLAKVAFGERSDGIVAVVATPTATLADLALPRDAVVVVIEAIEKPGNLGAVLRSADGAGASAVIVADPRTDPFNPNAIRASLGTIFAIPVVTATAAEALAWLVGKAIRPIAAVVDAALQYSDADLTGPVAIVLGSEAEGLSATWSDPRVAAVSIPMHGIADSLNVSTAAAILLYESVRQRTQGRDQPAADPAH
jgi:TrmH family RNA methyltransferase